MEEEVGCSAEEIKRENAMEEHFEDINAFKRFIKEKCPDTEIVFEKVNPYGRGNCLIIRVKSYKDCNTLFEKNTKWCIASVETHWNHYAGEGRRQYFILNFDLAQCENLKWVGFTIDSIQGLVAAHAVDDFDLLYASRTMALELKNGGFVKIAPVKNVHCFLRYTEKFGLKKFILYNLLGEEKKNLKYWFKKLFL